jgi:hypothetical protein
MAGITTYSFQDVEFIISHPDVGQFSANGEGLGSINVTMATDRTAHDVAADGSVMVSKMNGRNGSVGITIQQTSSLQDWLQRWYNYLETADVSVWADTSITVKASGMGELVTATGVSPQKQNDSPYQAQGQNVTWTLMAADIQKDRI